MSLGVDDGPKWHVASDRAPSKRDAAAVSITERVLGNWPGNVGEWEIQLQQGRLSPRLPDRKVVDLFCGCGGLSLGFQAAGFESLAAYDCWDKAISTYNLNVGNHAKLLDLADFDTCVSELESLGGSGHFPAIIGGPPCQDFSLAGNRKEAENANLTMKFAMIVSHFSPPFFVMENVSNAGRFPTYRQAIRYLEENQFHVSKFVVDAAKLGVPQRRKRLIAIGSKDEDLARWICVVLGNALETRAQMPSQTLDEWFGPGYVPELYYRHPRTYSRRGIFSSNEPSPTIRGVNRPMSETYKFIPADHLVIKDVKGVREVSAEMEDTVRVEVNRLDTDLRKQIQTFPKDFRLGAAQTHNEQMIGNAVPVMLGYFVAAVINDVLNELGR